MKPGDRIIARGNSKTVWTVLQVDRAGVVTATRQSKDKQRKGAWIVKVLGRPELYKRVEPASKRDVWHRRPELADGVDQG